MMRWRSWCLTRVALATALTAVTAAAQWQELPASQWRGAIERTIEGLPGQHRATIAWPRSQAEAIAVTTERLPAGVYEVRLTLRPSHVANAIAFHGGIQVRRDTTTVADLPGHFFARVHQPEQRSFELVHARSGPLALHIAAYADDQVVQNHRHQQAAPLREPTLGQNSETVTDALLALDLLTALSPDAAVYFVVDQVELRPLSRSGQLSGLTRNKVRYRPGEQLTGSVTITDVGRAGGTGTLDLYLEHAIAAPMRVQSLPVTLTAEPQVVPFTFDLPEEELGYALIAEYRAADGQDRHRVAEYFTIASHYNRVYIGGTAGGGHGATKRDEAAMRNQISSAAAEYVNASEMFAWAEEDMVEMSPQTDYWFSGQTCYHLKKEGLQQMIRLSHEYGIAQISYAKFIMSGYLGWKTAYDYPNDHRRQYHYPVGMWEGVNVESLDRFRNKEFQIYETAAGRIGQNPFYVWWADFMPINPDPTPRMTRIAAEEVVRSIEMFGWDGIRWDGHPRGGGQIGGSGTYDPRAARRTETLVRYFKEIVHARYPDAGFGYNYLLIQKEPTHGWAYEDFELDELARGGGLLMNESIGNATNGPFGYIARNLQVEGDLVRERSGYYLGIGFARSPRDQLVESALWAAGGARPYNSACTVAVRRYMTRFAQYTLDERLRRLATPEQILAPVADTRLWWQPFVYQTPLTDGRRQLVVNLLNLPVDEPRVGEEDAPRFVMQPGTEPVTFRLNLPDGYRADRVHLIDPQTLAVRQLDLADGHFEVPAIAHWEVAVIDLQVADGAPSLASLYGPPTTFGVLRPDRKEEPPPPLVLDPQADLAAASRAFAVLTDASVSASRQAELDALPGAERQARLLAIRAENPASKMVESWWRGGTLPADLERMATPLTTGDLSPRRNGVYDIYHARGAMDYRLRVPEGVAGLERFQLRDAPLRGLFRAGGGHSLADAISWQDFPACDLLLYTAIPHDAIGVDQSYALVDYVKAGGAVLFTGGEYAFGKGGYMHTVLERELLPVLCVETVDTRYSEAPLPLEPGPDWSELGVDLDFADRPSFQVWNQVPLKDDPRVKVFLASGNRPVLVGWQLGEGRVACLLLDHRGTSTDDTTAFFDWDHWPALMQAVLRWLAPAASQTSPPSPPPAAAEVDDLMQRLEGDAMEAAIADLDDPGGQARPDASLNGEALAERIRLLDRLLQAQPTDAIAAAMADQLTTVSLPRHLAWRLLDYLETHPPMAASRNLDGGLTSTAPEIRQSTMQLAALIGHPSFVAQLRRGPAQSETDAIGRNRALALGLLLYDQADLVELGITRVAAWDEEERTRKQNYTGGDDFSLAAPAAPMLAKEALFQRAAWLAYLSRHDPATWGARSARQWLLLSQYHSYCDRTLANLYKDKQIGDSLRAIKLEEMRLFRHHLSRLRQASHPDLLALLKEAPGQVADGFAEAHFTAEVRAAIAILGHCTVAESAPVLDRLKDAPNHDLATFARARSQ